MRLVGEEVDPAGHEQRVSTLPRAPPLLEGGRWHATVPGTWEAPRAGACHAGAERAQGRLGAPRPWGPVAGPWPWPWPTLPASCAASGVIKPPPGSSRSARRRRPQACWDSGDRVGAG